MSDIVIRAEGLGKKYIIGHQAERDRYTALRDVLAQNARAASGPRRATSSRASLTGRANDCPNRGILGMQRRNVEGG